MTETKQKKTKVVLTRGRLVVGGTTYEAGDPLEATDELLEQYGDRLMDAASWSNARKALRQGLEKRDHNRLGEALSAHPRIKTPKSKDGRLELAARLLGEPWPPLDAEG